MKQKKYQHQDSPERTIKDIRRQTRKRYSAEEKIRVVLAGLLGEDSIAEFSTVISAVGRQRCAAEIFRPACEDFRLYISMG